MEELLAPALEVGTDRETFTLELIEKIKKGESKLSYSSIAQFKKSPRSFIDYKLGKKEQTDAMKLGSLVHCLILTPDLFEKAYFVFDDSEKVNEIGGGNPRATTVYKAWKAEKLLTVEDKITLSKSEFDQASLMADAVLNNSSSKKIIEKCAEREKKVFFEFNDLSFISFFDGIGTELIADIKICQDADPKKFQRTIINDGYYLQAGVYMTAIEELKPYFLIAVDRSGGVSVHLLMDNLIEHGMNEFDKLTREFKDCMINNDFHCSYEYRAFEGIHKIDKPAYL